MLIFSAPYAKAPSKSGKPLCVRRFLREWTFIDRSVKVNPCQQNFGWDGVTDAQRP